MVSHKLVVSAVVLLVVATFTKIPARAGQTSTQSALPLEPTRDRGSSITPAYEGWFANADGSFTMLIGYFNRNLKQTLDIPVGPNNRVEPGDPDQGQPTYFEVRRQWGVFSIRVPKDFGTRKLTWTITSNGETQSVPFTLHKNYEIEPYKESGMGNTPPTVTFTRGGRTLTGPPLGIAQQLTGAVMQPVTITFWGDDKRGPLEEPGGRGRGAAAPPFTASFHKFRGPGEVSFENARPPANRDTGEVSTTATFSAVGDYVVRVQVNDASGDGGAGFQCCWTNVHVGVTVK
jgi:hypothetical protein